MPYLLQHHVAPCATYLSTNNRLGWCSLECFKRRAPGRAPRLVCHSFDLPSTVRGHLEDLGVPANAFSGLGKSDEFTRNAEPALVTLSALTSKQRVRTLLVGNPQLLCVPLGVWLDFLTAYGMSRQDFFSLLGSSPELFTRGSLFGAGSVIAYLQSLGLSPRDVVASVIPRCPRLLLRDVVSDLRPAVDFLEHGLELDRAGVRDLLCRCPGVLCQDPAADLAPRLELLCAVGFGRRTACRLLASDGALLTGDLAGALQLRLDFLMGDCGLSGDQASEVLVRCPAVLSLSPANLGRKWRFLTQRMGGGREQALAYPQFLSQHLLLQIGPRFAYATERLGLPWSGGGCSCCSTSSDLDSGHRSDDADRSSSSSSSASKGTSTSSGSCSVDSSGSRSGGIDSASSSGVSSAASAAAELSLQELLEGDDRIFLERAWAAAAAGAGAGAGGSAAGRAGSRAAEGAGEGARGIDAGGTATGFGGGEGGVMGNAGSVAEAGWLWDAEQRLVDFHRFRSGWLEREGARWTGVRSVAATGSW